MKDKIKNYFQKEAKNYRWELRFNNLQKKYNDLQEENKELKKLLKEDEKIQKINNQKKYIKMIINQRNKLREELKR